MQFGRTLCSLALALSCALAGGVAHAQTNPTLTTDRQDYLPGETAILMGAGFQPGETVDVSIAIDDDFNNVHVGDYDWMVELADDSGDFMTFWTVPIEAYGMTLRATALGLTSGFVATTTFFDNHGTHNVNFKVIGMTNRVPADGFPINMVINNPVSHATQTLNSAVTVSTNGTTSASIGVAAAMGNVFYGNYPSEYSVSGFGTWNLVSALPPSGFTPGLSGETTTVELTYSFTPACTATNAAPSLAATSLNLADSCPANGVLNVTVGVAQFLAVVSDPNNDPYIVTFADGSSTQDLTFSPTVSSHVLTLKATDNPSARNQTGCPALPSLSTTFNVTVSATVYAQPTNEAPVVSASNIDLGNVCVDSSLTVPVSLADFNPAADDLEDDNFTFSINGVTEVTLTLPPNVSDQVVSVPVVISATDDPASRNCGVCTPLSPMTGSTIAYVTATLHRNSAPLITAGNVNLGDLVGILSAGTFGRSVPVSPALFSAVATDPEGDPVTIAADVSNVTLVGPGVAAATVTLTATDDPATRTAGACAPASSSLPVQVSARIVYRFDGPLFPLNTCLATKVRRGSIVPVRFRLYDANNVEVTTVPVNPAGGPTYHSLSVAFNQANAPDGAVDVDDIGCGDENDDFHYFLGAWTYVLLTNSTYQLHTTYLIRIYPNDGTVHNIMMSIK